MLDKVRKRIKNSFDDFETYVKYFSVRYAFWRALNILLAGGYCKKINEYAWKRRHEYVDRYLREKYGHIAKKYKNISMKGLKPEGKYIWVSWWQGIENAPELVKSCYQNLMEKQKDSTVILITKENFQDYIEIPSYIINKVEDGIISMAALSDIIPASMLERWGGVWLHATIYLSRPIEEKCFDAFFYTAKKNVDSIEFVSQYRWTGFFIAGSKEFPLWRFLKEFYWEYWQNEKQIIDYLLPDYAIKLAYDEIASVKQYIDAVPYNNGKIDDLISIFNQPYDEQKYKEICETDTYVFKLGYREKQFLECKTEKGEKTFYSVILNIDN